MAGKGNKVARLVQSLVDFLTEEMFPVEADMVQKVLYLSLIVMKLDFSLLECILQLKLYKRAMIALYHSHDYETSSSQLAF